MPIAASVNSDPPGEVLSKSRERRALSVACGAHALHDGYTDLIWVALPIWQAEFALSYAAVGLLRMIYSGTMAALQIPAAHCRGARRWRGTGARYGDMRLVLLSRWRGR